MFRILCILLFASLNARGAVAWGPYTHAAVSRWALDRIREHGPARLAFLTREPARTYFVAASMGPDMTFSVTGLGKTDRELDGVLHGPEFGRKLLQEALAAGEAERVAFALGWGSHAVADGVMCVPGSVIYRNVFDLGPGASDSLEGDVPGLLKIAIDALLAQSDPALLKILPMFDLPLLETALGDLAPAELAGGGTKASRRLQLHAESFTGAMTSLREICRSLAANRKAFPGLAREITGADALTVPGLDESSVAVARWLETVFPAGCRVVPNPARRPPAPKGTLGVWDRLTSGLTRRGRGLLAGDGLASQVTRGVLDGVMQAMNAMGVARGRTRRARVKATFMGKMLAGEHDWPAVKAAVRAVAEERRGTAGPEGDEAISPDDAPLDRAP